MNPTPQQERQRLNRRIRNLPKTVARELKAYRQRISSISAVNRRGASMVFVPRGTSGFMEGADVIQLCHEFLDQRKIAPSYTEEESHTAH